jgi:hypothetical protein
VFALALACTDDGPTNVPSVYTAQFTLSNALIAPITILVDGEPNVILNTGMTATVSASTRSHVTWRSAKPADALGHMIPDEIGENSINVYGMGQTYEITNIINDQPYFTASIFNQTTSVVSIGVFDGQTVACAGVLPAASTNVGFVQIGYYRATPRTELRAYNNPSGCTGSYVIWPPSQIAQYAPKSGLLRVTLTN